MAKKMDMPPILSKAELDKFADLAAKSLRMGTKLTPDDMNAAEIEKTNAAVALMKASKGSKGKSKAKKEDHVSSLLADLRRLLEDSE